MDNALHTFIKLLQLLKVKYTKVYATDIILSQSDYPNLLAISESLSHYKIDSAAVKVENDSLDKLPLPCVVQVMVKENERAPAMLFFHTLEKVTDKDVTYYNYLNKKKTVTKKQFIEQWTGIALLVEKNKNSQEPNITEKLKKRRVEQVLRAMFLVCLLMILVRNTTISEISLPVLLFFILNILGLVISYELVRYEISVYKPKLQHFCKGGKKLNCEAVLYSKQAQLLGGSLSLSTVAFSYFLAGFLLQVFSFKTNTFLLLGNISILSLIVIIYSIYTQAVTLKKWCRFCLMLLGVMLLEIVVAYWGRFYGNIDQTLSQFLIFIGVAIYSLLSFMFLKPFLEQRKMLPLYKRALNKFKDNPNTFKALLQDSEKIQNEPTGLGISLENKNPNYKIIKVCNPYCGPCAQAHPVLESLYKKGVIDLQILFTVHPEESYTQTAPVSHLLALAEKGDEDIIHKSLNDWYSMKKKDYSLFAKQYTLNGEMKLQRHKIKAMSDWCILQGISHTPTIYIDGHELPEQYSIDDLTNLLS
jgi:uncharacterized membrane protein